MKMGLFENKVITNLINIQKDINLPSGLIKQALHNYQWYERIHSALVEVIQIVRYVQQQFSEKWKRE